MILKKYWLLHIIMCTTFANSLVTPNTKFNDPDDFRNTTEIVRSRGYPAEDHDVFTDDGYILSIQRIPYGKNKSTSRIKADNFTNSGIYFESDQGHRSVVLLQHGLLDSSATWIMNLENESLGFLLADAGFDVWLGNMRGNTYGKRHKTLSPNSDEFWNFSWDDMSKSDLPSMVNYILKITGEDKLSYIGHSQGTMIGFAQFDANKDLASKIKVFIGLGPVAQVGHIESPIRYLAGPSPQTDALWYALFGKKAFLPSSALIKWFAEKVCDHKIPDIFCENVIFLLAGPSSFMNQTRLPVYLTHTPAGTSVKNMLHYSQAVYTKKFQMFDYGSESQNKLHYNQSTPPLYDLKNVNVPVGLIWSQNDWLADPEDVQYLRENLPNIVYDKYVPHWDHLDFVWATDAAQVIYEDMIKLLLKYN